MIRWEASISSSEDRKMEEDQVQKVKNYIYSLLAEKKIQLGDRLPSEKALSEQLDVTKSVVRDALQSLKSVGLLSSLRGSGYKLTPDFDRSLADIMHVMVMYSSTTRRDIRQVREALEIQVLELLIRQGPKEELVRELQEQVDIMMEYMDKDIETQEDALRLAMTDIRFHTIMAVYSDNIFIRAFNSALSEYHDSNTRITPELIQSRVSPDLIISHKRILDSIIKKDIMHGVDAIREHYKISDRVMVNGEEDPILQTAISRLQKKGFTRAQIMEKLMELE